MEDRVEHSRLVSSRREPGRLEEFIAFFAGRWGNEAIYRNCMESSIGSGSLLPQWYLLEERGGEVIGGAGLITNDFISRMDLWPWLCSLYIEEAWRGRVMGLRLVGHVCAEASGLGFENVYLCTGHTGYYERSGFEYIGDGMHPWGEESRIYRKRLV